MGVLIVWRKMLKYMILAVSAVVVIGLLTNRPPFTDSTSPDGEYRVEIWTRRGFGLLNVPEYVKIVVKKPFSFQKRTIHTEISNDDISIDADQNIYIFWEVDQLTIILLGCEQRPEFITVSLEKGFPYECHQYDIPKDVSDSILKSYERRREREATGSPYERMVPK